MAYINPEWGKIEGNIEDQTDLMNITLRMEMYDLYTEVPISGPNAIIFVTHDDSPSGDNTESQFFRHNNNIFYIATVKQ